MDAATDPLAAFADALARARSVEKADPTAVALATAGADGRPSVRMVLLKGVDPRGIVFFTNYESRKARQMAERPWAAICAHWPALEEQVRAEGAVERVSEAESDEYFATRPRGSQIGAWASRQSEPLGSRDELLERARQIADRWTGQPIPRPPFWGGYRLVPDRIEHWKGRPDRLHERYLFLRTAEGWSFQLLQP